jgi:predicted dienelactone hydrolase
MRRLLATACLLFLGCGDPWLESGGLARRSVPVKTRGLDTVEVTLVAPGNGQGPSLAPRTGFVLAPGGLVPPHRYVPLAEELARLGFAVAIPEFPGDLGFFAPENVAAAARLLRRGDSSTGIPALAPERIVVAGHSLGGVVAAAEAVGGEYAALVFLASLANGTDPVETLEIPMLSVAGERDCSLQLPAARAGFERLPSGALFATVAGLTHYGFTDSLVEDERRACLGSVPLEDGHRLVARLIQLFLAARLDGNTFAADALRAGIPGVTFEVRP